MIDRFDAHHLLGDRMVMLLHVLHQAQFRRGGADDQDLQRIANGMRDLVIVLLVLRRMPCAGRARLVVQMLVLRARTDLLGFGRIVVEVHDVRFAVVEPHDGVIE